MAGGLVLSLAEAAMLPLATRPVALHLPALGDYLRAAPALARHRADQAASRAGAPSGRLRRGPSVITPPHSRLFGGSLQESK